MRAFLHDLRYGIRVLLGHPGFSSVAILTLGLGLACTTTVFSWIESVLLRPYPGTARAERLAELEMVTPSAPNGGVSISWQDFRDFSSQLSSVNGIALHRQSAFMLGEELTPRLAWGELVSVNYFDVLGVKPLLGRVFTPGENSDALGAQPVAVISARLWRQHFHSDPLIVGTTVHINRHPLTVVGVAVEDFRGTSQVIRFDLWVPATMGPALGMVQAGAFSDRGYRGTFSAICRLRDGVAVEQAAAEARALAGRLEAAYPKSNRGVSATVVPTWSAHNGVNEYLLRPLLILMAVSAVVLLIVCANVTNLLLARSIGRQREFGIRAALGAGRARIASQVLIETLVLSLAGTLLGILILYWVHGSLVAMVPSVGFPIQTAFAWSWRMLGFSAMACVGVTILAGAAPALFALHSRLHEMLKEGSRSTGAGTSHKIRNVLAAAEVALATVALVGASLFIRSFENTRHVDPGFQADGVLFGRFFIETTGYSGDAVQQFAARLKERMLSSPAVESATYSDFVPLSTTAGPYNNVGIDGYVPAQGESMAVNRAMVSPGYFATMRIPLLEGRDFDARDDRTAEQPVMIVNQAFAKRFFGGRNPVGRKVRALGKDIRIAGMVQDSKYFSPAEPPMPFFYLPFHQFYGGTPELYFLARTRVRPADAAAEFRSTITSVDPNASAVHIIPLAEYTEVATFGQRVAATLMGALGLVCLILAGTGLYSVMSYTVSERIPEIGIRMAMGATPWDVLRIVVVQGMGIAGAGLLAGVVATLAATRWIASMLFGVSPADPASFLAAGVFLGIVTLLSTGVPAWRATRTDPVSAMRR